MPGRPMPSQGVCGLHSEGQMVSSIGPGTYRIITQVNGIWTETLKDIMMGENTIRATCENCRDELIDAQCLSGDRKKN